MLCLFNHHTGVHTEYRTDSIESGRLEPIQFEIVPSRFKTREYEAVLRIPCFSKGIGYFKSMKKAKDSIERYYDQFYNELVQLKAIGKIRCDFPTYLNEHPDVDIHETAKELISIEKFPLVPKVTIWDSQQELVRTWEQSRKRQSVTA